MEKRELREMLAEWSNSWVAEFVCKNILPYADEALENPCFVKVLKEWHEYKDNFEIKRKAMIIRAMKKEEEFNEDDCLLKIYKEKAERYSEIMYEFFRDEVFKEEASAKEGE